MKRSNLLIAFYLVLLFVAGMVVGVFGYRLYVGTPVSAKMGTTARPPKLTPEEWRRQYTAELRNRLNLSSDQVQKLGTILDETHNLFHQAHERSDLEIKTIREQQVSKIRAILTDAQRPEYEKIRAEHERAKQAQQAQQKK